MYNRIKSLKYIINIPNGVKVKYFDNQCFFYGTNGEIKHNLEKNMFLNIKEDKIYLSFNEGKFKKRDYKKMRSLIKTHFKLIKNCIFGVLNLFSKELIIKGVGYKAEYDKLKSILLLNLGFSHIIKINVPNYIKINIRNNLHVIISGISKDEVGRFAANVKSKRMPDSYKGNGIKFKEEKLKLKIIKKGK